MHKLHPAQQKLLDVLKQNVNEPLTIRTIQELLGASSTSVVHHHITQLEKKGYLRRNPANPSDYQVLADSPEKDVAFINVYGMAHCGPNGSILDGSPVERIRISSRLLGFSAGEAFIVKAKGASMMPKINSGDLVIAKKTSNAKDGDIAVCVNDGEAIIKKVQKIKNSAGQYTYNLISLNPNFLPFTASEDFKIEGVVKSVLSYSV